MFFYQGSNYMEEDYFDAFFLVESGFAPHLHRSFELIHLIDGEISVFLDEKEYRLRPKQLIFAFPEQIHEIRSLRPSKITVIQFAPELVGHFSSHYRNLIPLSPVLSGLYHPADTLCFANIYEKKAFLYRLCALLTSSSDFIPAPARQTPLFALLSYIQNNFCSECSLREAAKQTGYDYAYLSRLFRAKTGLSFTACVTQYRISHASSLLSHSSDSVSTIAYACGFNTIRSFNRSFRTLTGMTPEEYRKKMVRPAKDRTDQ